MFRKAQKATFPKEYIFKYCSDDSSYHLDILINSTFYFSHVEEFNDPFEFLSKMKLPQNLEELKVFIEQSLLNHDLNPESKEGKRHAKAIWDMYRMPSETVDFTTQKSMLDRVSDLSGVCCFSMKYKNILMWSHYANRHRGYTLIFDPRNHHFFNELKPVNYKRELPVVNPVQFDVQSLYTKNKDWKYEKEVRLISSNIRRSEPFPPDRFKGIIFGAKCSDSTKQRLYNILSKSYKNIKYYQAEQSREKYQLVVREICQQTEIIPKLKSFKSY